MNQDKDSFHNWMEMQSRQRLKNAPEKTTKVPSGVFPGMRAGSKLESCGAARKKMKEGARGDYTIESEQKWQRESLFSKRAAASMQKQIHRSKALGEFDKHLVSFDPD